MLRNSGEHLWANLLIVMKGEGDIGPSLASQSSMRTRFALDDPADAKERCENPSRFGRAPGRHAALKVTLRRLGAPSPWSRRSARTRRARAWTCAMASSLLCPYV